MKTQTWLLQPAVPSLISMPRLALITADPSSRSITSSPSRPVHSSHMGIQNEKDGTSNCHFWGSTSSPKVLPHPFAKLSGAHSTYPWSQTCFRRCCNFVQTKWPPRKRHNSRAQKASKSIKKHQKASKSKVYIINCVCASSIERTQWVLRIQLSGAMSPDLSSSQCIITCWALQRFLRHYKGSSLGTI